MNDQDKFKNQLEKLQYDIASAGGTINLDQNSINKLSEDVIENTQKELENISKTLESNLEDISNIATNELYMLKNETKSIADRVSEMIKQIEKVKEININLLDLIEMKNAVLEKEGKKS